MVKRPYVYSVRRNEWLDDLKCICCSRLPAMWMSELAYWCRSPEDPFSCANVVGNYKLPARRRVAENKSEFRHGRNGRR